MTHSDNRKDALLAWLKTHIQTPFELTLASSDASFRRYFRVHQEQQTYIAMDAPPEKEPIGTFIEIAEQLEKSTLNVPHIFASDPRQGFILCSDLGEQHYFDAKSNNNIRELYNDAINSLITIQQNADPAKLPIYDKAFLKQELDIFPEWFIKTHLKYALDKKNLATLHTTFDLLIQNAIEQPFVFVHRDYHSRNLMVCPNKNPGILDFQGALRGPITYDIVSLLKDCYIEWPDEMIKSWLSTYHSSIQKRNLIDVDLVKFTRWFDLMGMQRHLKVLGIFSRLNYRDKKPHYLLDIPRVSHYIKRACQRYDELQPFYELFQTFDIE